jgi:serine phosphatase RsbU (regulator of sigma subunit)
VLGEPGEVPRRVTDSGGPPLCVISGYAYSGSELTLVPRGWLCALSDGVTEAMNRAGGLYGAARLLTALAESGSSEPATLVQQVRDEVRRFSAGAEPWDDVTLACVRWNGASGR